MYPFINVFGSSISTFTLMIGIGIILGLLLLEFLCKKRNVPASECDNLTLIIALSIPIIFISSALFDKFAHFKTQREFIDNLFKYTGISYLGGFLGGISFFIIMYKSIFKSFKNFDIHSSCLVPSVLLAHFFGRIGCFLGGCCFGFPLDAQFCFAFSHGTPAYLLYGSKRLFPTQLIEALALLIIFFIMLFIIKKHSLFWYMLFYGVTRFFIEFLRGDNRGTFLISILSPSQYISIVMIFAALLFLLRREADKSI